uniref:EF-hand domain-containing protein n=1 Tax=Timema tahoe TaxID=61484 RepID=A0A7R9IC99_9NEOP|nr:unnamed protein product [Timema tahoe]
MLAIVEFGSSYSCGCSNCRFVLRISHAAREVNNSSIVTYNMYSKPGPASEVSAKSCSSSTDMQYVASAIGSSADFGCQRVFTEGGTRRTTTTLPAGDRNKYLDTNKFQFSKFRHITPTTLKVNRFLTQLIFTLFQAHHAHHPQGQQILNAANVMQEKDHIQEHMEVPMDTSKMTEQELQFHYFKMHDADNNNKLDGSELIKSLIHWHEQGHQDPNNPTPQGEKIFSDEELLQLIDPILNMDDGNNDGYIDYPEFVRAQQKAAANTAAPRH